MIPNQDTGNRPPSGTPFFLFVCLLGLLSAGIAGFYGAIGFGLAGVASAYTFPKLAMMGGSFVVGLAGLVGLLSGIRLGRNFCYLSLAALGATASLFFFTESGRDDPSIPFKDLIALVLMCLSYVSGGVVRLFVTRFGSKSRTMAGIAAVISSVAAFPLSAGILYANAYAAMEDYYVRFPGHQKIDLANHVNVTDHIYLSNILAQAFWTALCVALVGGWIGAVIGAIRDSKVHRGGSSPLSSNSL